MFNKHTDVSNQIINFIRKKVQKKGYLGHINGVLFVFDLFKKNFQPCREKKYMRRLIPSKTETYLGLSNQYFL